MPETQFVKSERYSDGLYPSCKSCRRSARITTLSQHPLCYRCGIVPHQASNGYCYECDRLMKGREKPAKYRRDSKNKTMCCRCKVNPRQEYHGYCRPCANISVRISLARRRHIRPPDEHRRKASARHYINTLLRRGKIKRKPCKYCGAPSKHFHHLDYNDRTTNIEHVCHKCHVSLERDKRKALTLNPS